MALPTTWKNVAAPNVADYGRNMILANQQISQAQDAMAQTVDDYVTQAEKDALADAKLELQQMDTHDAREAFLKNQQQNLVEPTGLNLFNPTVAELQATLPAMRKDDLEEITARQTYKTEDDRIKVNQLWKDVGEVGAKYGRNSQEFKDAMTEIQYQMKFNNIKDADSLFSTEANRIARDTPLKISQQTLIDAGIQFNDKGIADPHSFTQAREETVRKTLAREFKKLHPFATDATITTKVDEALSTSEYKLAFTRQKKLEGDATQMDVDINTFAKKMSYATNQADLTQIVDDTMKYVNANKAKITPEHEKIIHAPLMRAMNNMGFNYDRLWPIVQQNLQPPIDGITEKADGSTATPRQIRHFYKHLEGLYKGQIGSLPKNAIRAFIDKNINEFGVGTAIANGRQLTKHQVKTREEILAAAGEKAKTEAALKAQIKLDGIVGPATDEILKTPAFKAAMKEYGVEGGELVAQFQNAAKRTKDEILSLWTYTQSEVDEMGNVDSKGNPIFAGDSKLNAKEQADMKLAIVRMFKNHAKFDDDIGPKGWSDFVLAHVDPETPMYKLNPLKLHEALQGFLPKDPPGSKMSTLRARFKKAMKKFYKDNKSSLSDKLAKKRYGVK